MIYRLTKAVGMMLVSVLLFAGCQTAAEGESFVTIELAQLNGIHERTFPVNDGDNELQATGDVYIASGSMDIKIQSSDGLITFYETTINPDNSGKMTINMDDLQGVKEIKLIVSSSDARDIKLEMAFAQKLALNPDKPEKPGKIAGAVNQENLFNSYYDGQNHKPYQMIQRGMISRLVRDWTEYSIDPSIENPVWNFDTFAQYQILDQDLNPVAGDMELYYCTFSADNSRHGYFVLSYEADDVTGGGMGHIDEAETFYLYDLRANVDVVMERLNRTDIDLSQATASRGKLMNAENTGWDEIILFRDDANAYVLYLETLELVQF